MGSPSADSCLCCQYTPRPQTSPQQITILTCTLGELLTRGDVCHLHAERGDAERCGVLLDGTPELVRLDEVRQAVTVSSGRCRLRRADGSGKTASLTVVVALNRLCKAPHSWIKPRN